MRNFIDSVVLTESWDHPHASGEDEWFKLFFRYWINVDQAKTMIVSGEIKPEIVKYPVKTIASTLFGMDSEDFGSNNFEDTMDDDLFSGPPVTRSRMPSIPEDKMSEPPLFVMFNGDQANAIVNHKDIPDGGREFPTLVDGNHRIVRRFLSGDTSVVDCQFIRWPDVKKICYDANDLETPLVDLEKDNNAQLD